MASVVSEPEEATRRRRRLVIASSSNGGPGYRTTLPRAAASARYARDLVTMALQVWHLEELEESAHIVLNELVANSVLHARGERVLVAVTRQGAGVRVAVVDRSRVLPQRRRTSPYEEHGRGLEIVNALSDGHWGTDPMRWGKRVWALLAPPP